MKPPECKGKAGARVDSYIKMSDIYKNVEKKPLEVKKERKVLMLALSTFLALILIALFVVQPLIQHARHIKFVSALSSSTEFSGRRGTASCTISGETFPLNSETVYEIYAKMTLSEAVEPCKEPEENPGEGILIDYGDMSSLRIYPWTFADGRNGIYVEYRNLELEHIFKSDWQRYKGLEHYFLQKKN
ncbi:MAG: hypothetical protein GX975_01100 [Clostridiales bacterium]|nr:hypothetical protein [Clostridiales bacterium]